jgi:hypothetical protein
MKQRQSQSPIERQPDTAEAPSFESAPWSALELVLEEPRRAAEAALRLEHDDHVVDVELDGDSILRNKL